MEVKSQLMVIKFMMSGRSSNVIVLCLKMLSLQLDLQGSRGKV